MKSLIYLTVMATFLFSEINTAFADESTEQEFRTLRAENNLLRATIKRQKKQIDSLKEQVERLTAEIARLRSGDVGEEVNRNSDADNGKKIGLPELFDAAKRYLAEPEEETRAARELRRKKIIDAVTNRKVIIKGTLQDVHTIGEHRYVATVHYVSPRKLTGISKPRRGDPDPPAEKVVLTLIITDDAVVDLAKGTKVEVEGVIASPTENWRGHFSKGGPPVSFQQFRYEQVIRRGDGLILTKTRLHISLHIIDGQIE